MNAEVKQRIKVYTKINDDTTVDYLCDLLCSIDKTDESAKWDAAEAIKEMREESIGIESTTYEDALAFVESNISGSIVEEADSTEGNENKVEDLLHSLFVTTPENKFESQQFSQNVTVLQDIIGDQNCDQIHKSTIEKILSENDGDLQRAALWVSENNLESYQSVIERKQLAKEKERVELQKNNVEITKRYALVPKGVNKPQKACLDNRIKKMQVSIISFPPGTFVSICDYPYSLDFLGQAAQSKPARSSLRYRDSQVVSSKGEKYISEKLSEEWDGGSRGKVYTKGKRGKGVL